MKNITIESNGYELEVHYFAVESPKAIVQIMHGMEEHQERYEPFCQFLNANGFSVYTSNMRGHGSNAPVLGYFGKKNGYKLLVQDQIKIATYIKENNPDKKIYLFAHSMGTIVARNVLMTSSHFYNKICLSGFPNPNFGAYIGLPVANTVSLFKGPEHYSQILEDLAVGQFNKAVSNPKTGVDWVCKNESTVNDYVNDPYCGHGFKAKAFSDLFHLVIKMRHSSNYNDVNDVPVLMLRGAEDPCTGYSKGAKHSIHILRKAGFTNIKEIVYPGMRHEILNEVEHEQVYNDILNFYN